MEAKKKEAFRLGIYVLIGLALLTGIEYYVAWVSPTAFTILFVIALLKAAAIIQYFMHITSLWSEEEH